MSDYDEARSPSRTSAASKQLNGSQPQSANFTIGAGVPADVASRYHDSESLLPFRCCLPLCWSHHQHSHAIRQPCMSMQARSYFAPFLCCNCHHICRPGVAHCTGVSQLGDGVGPTNKDRRYYTANAFDHRDPETPINAKDPGAGIMFEEER